jgi:hypothetical protein
MLSRTRLTPSGFSAEAAAVVEFNLSDEQRAGENTGAHVFYQNPAQVGRHLRQPLPGSGTLKTGCWGWIYEGEDGPHATSSKANERRRNFLTCCVRPSPVGMRNGFGALGFPVRVPSHAFSRISTMMIHFTACVVAVVVAVLLGVV